MKKISILFIISIVFNIVLLTLLFQEPILSVYAPIAPSSIRLTIQDGFSEKKLADANICIIETGKYYKSDSNGLSGHIEVPYLKNEFHNNPQPNGEISILVYKKGYVDFLIFHVMVYSNSTRMLTLNIYPSDGETDTLYTLIESPDNSWAKQVRDKYKK